MKIGGITKKLMRYYHRNRVDKQDFVSALVLYELSEKKQDFAQLKERINEVSQELDLAAIMSGRVCRTD
jgi:predicted amino acid-binding ACT domain protein